MMLLFVYYITQLLELLLSIWVMYKLYPNTRKRKNMHKMLFFVVSVLLSLLYTWNAWDSFISTVAIWFWSIWIPLVYCCFFEANYKKLFVWQFMYSTNIAFLKMPMMIITGITTNRNLVEINRGMRGWSEVLWCILLMTIVWIFIIWICKNIEILRALLQRKLLFLMIGCVQIHLMKYNMSLGKKGFHSTDLVISLILICCIALLMQYLGLYIVYQKHKAEKSIINATQVVSQNYILMIQDFYNRNNKRLHNIKHDMLCIAGHLENRDLDKAKCFVDKYISGVKQIENTVWTGLPFLDFMLNYKKSEIDEENIGFTLDLELYQYPFEDSELGVVLGNLLDNAIEASKLCTREQRYIDMMIKNLDNIFVLSIRNGCTKRACERNGKFVSSKDNKAEHGLGLASVECIVKKYDGEIRFQYDNEYFQVNILI